VAKIFKVETPEQLRGLNEFVKDGRVLPTATVWSASRRKGGKCPWDEHIMVSFRTEGTNRLASVFRISKDEEMDEMATLKYTQALQWCKTELLVISD
jgi:phosphorylcholine metabolism protein LicD